MEIVFFSELTEINLLYFFIICYKLYDVTLWLCLSICQSICTSIMSEFYQMAKRVLQTMLYGSP